MAHVHRFWHIENGKQNTPTKCNAPFDSFSHNALQQKEGLFLGNQGQNSNFQNPNLQTKTVMATIVLVSEREYPHRDLD
jgi:hypothetical protein